MFGSRIKKRLLFSLSLVLALSVALAHAQKKDRDGDGDDDDDDRPLVRPHELHPGEKPMDADFTCPYVKGYQKAKHIEKFTLRMHAQTKTPADRCQALLSGKGIEKPGVPVASDWSLTVDKISGSDVNGDGKPELVIEGYSGGDRCCLTYSVISLSNPPRVLRKIETLSPLTFDRLADGKLVIRGADTTFDYFIVPHSVAVIPQVLFRLDGDRLIDAGSQFTEQYDQKIAEARGKLTPEDLEKFRQAHYNDKMFTDQISTVQNILTIVLNYLYSGREEQAWKALQDLWPASDQSRIKALILERRNRGLISQLKDAGAQTASAQESH